MIRIKVPPRVKIGSFDYRVVYKEDMKLDENWRGSINQRKGLIEIDPRCGVGKDRTFLHEVVHQITFNYELDVSENSISCLANGFAEFLFNSLGIELDWQDIK